MTEEAKKNEKDALSKIQALPQAIQDFIWDAKQSEVNIEIVRKFNLTPEQEDLYFDITDKVIFKEMKLEDFPAEVEKQFGFDKEKLRELSLEILGNVFLPLDSFLGNVSNIIKKLGGDPNKFTVQHVELQKITAEELTQKIIVETQYLASMSTETQDIASLRRRLKNIIINRFNGVRDDEETLATLMRGNKVGGLGLSEELGKKIIQSIKAKIGAFQVAEKQDVASKPVETQNVASLPTVKGAPPDNLPTKVVKGKKNVAEGFSPPQETGREENKESTHGNLKVSATTASASNDIVYGAEEEREIAHHQRELEKKQIIDKAIKFNEEVEKSIQNILEKGKLSFSDENLKQRFLKVVSARLRDVRDKNETLELFIRDRNIGGLGLKEESGKKILNLIEMEFESLTRLRQKGELKKLEEWKKQQESEKKDKKEKEEKEEEKVLEKKWVKLTGKPVPKPVFKIVSEEKKDVAEDVAETFRFPQETGRAVSKERAYGNLKVSTTTSPPAPLKPSSPPAAQIASGEGKPKVESVKFTPKLVGPIDELRRITIVDFRRLAKNPKDAIEKIKDKVELLEDESYTKKIEGIKAWQESEPSKIYFEILNQSMRELTSIAEILTRRAEKKLPNLTKEEFNALMELNKELRV